MSHSQNVCGGDHETGRDFRANLPAHRVDQELRRSLAALQRAEKSVVLWFAEMVERKLYVDLGFSSVYQYANAALGFSENKTYRFLRLTDDLKRLPRLRESVATGELGWTKAREVAKVASQATEARWIAVAKKTSRREFEQKVVAARQRAAVKRKSNPMQGKLGACSMPDAAKKPAKNPNGKQAMKDIPVVDDGLVEDPVTDELVADGPTSVVIRFTSTELARYEALVEKAHKDRKVSPGATRAEVILAGLDSLLGSGAVDSDGGEDSIALERSGHELLAEPEKGEVADREPSTGHCTGQSNTGEPKPVAGSNTGVEIPPQHCVSDPGVGVPPLHCVPDPGVKAATNYRIVIYQCSTCQRSFVRTDRGQKRITAAELETIKCDAIIQENGRRSRSTIPPSIRNRVLARDQHRCQTPGCKRTRFLEVHHIHPVARGGSNRPENLTTLCSGCHRLGHSRTLTRAHSRTYKPKHPQARVLTQ
ncbi:HNH endonuclease [Candidatus Eisenbacteria bacterium]|uniref:HNH endonuclease n=1 Tax=Eiseniibacteriota bacterium TaxID=2212470 RepID=A0ABV6YIW2_UNCEI